AVRARSRRTTAARFQPSKVKGPTAGSWSFPLAGQKGRDAGVDRRKLALDPFREVVPRGAPEPSAVALRPSRRDGGRPQWGEGTVRAVRDPATGRFEQDLVDLHCRNPRVRRLV